MALALYRVLPLAGVGFAHATAVPVASSTAFRVLPLPKSVFPLRILATTYPPSSPPRLLYVSFHLSLPFSKNGQRSAVPVESAPRMV